MRDRVALRSTPPRLLATPLPPNSAPCTHPRKCANPAAAEVRGNPTEYYRRAGSGSSVGAGVKVGAVRAEAIRDNNSGKTHVWLSYGERF